WPGLGRIGLSLPGMISGETVRAPAMTPIPTSLVLSHIRALVAAERLDHLDDAALLEWFVRRREEAAFAALVRRHGPPVLGVCRRALAAGHDAEDAFQATFLVLLRKAGSIARRGALGVWLARVAYHAAVKARARAARQRHDRRPERDRPADPLAEVTGRELL